MTQISVRFPHWISIVLLAAATLSAQDTALVLDSAQTKVEFTLGDTLHTVRGTFQLKRGDLHFDPATGHAAGELVVDARSGASGSTARDKKMHKEILESEKFPDIIFRPDRMDGKIEPQGSFQVQVHGIFTLHGADHEITVPAEVQASGGQYSVVVHFDVPYVKWGLKNPSNFLLRVDDKVEITIHGVAKPRPASAMAN